MANRDGFRRRHCIRCGTPFLTIIARLYDCQLALCESCDPSTHIEKPRVHLFGAPDGQELARWSEKETNR